MSHLAHIEDWTPSVPSTLLLCTPTECCMSTCLAGKLRAQSARASEATVLFHFCLGGPGGRDGIVVRRAHVRAREGQKADAFRISACGAFFFFIVFLFVRRECPRTEVGVSANYGGTGMQSARPFLSTAR